MTDSLEIVSPGLLNTLVGSNGGISGSSSEVLAVLVGDVFALGVLVALGETEIDDIDVVAGGVLTTDQEVVRLDVSVDDPLIVHFFNALDQLDGDHQDGFQIEIALARREEILEGGSEQVHHHHVELVVRH